MHISVRTVDPTLRLVLLYVYICKHTVRTKALTSNQHQDDREYFLVVRVGGNVAKTHRDEAGEAKVETSAIATL